MKYTKIVMLLICLCFLSSITFAFADGQPVDPKEGLQPPADGGQMEAPFMAGDFQNGWEKLLEEKVIDEDVYNTIQEYLKQNMPEQGEFPQPGEAPTMENGAAGMPTMPEPPDGALMNPPQMGTAPDENGMTPPADGNNEGQPPEPGIEGGMNAYPGVTAELLDELLKNEILDSDLYNTILELIGGEK